MRAWVIPTLAVLTTVGCNLDRDTSQPEPTPAPKRRVVIPDDPAPPKPEPKPVAKVDLALGAGFEMRRPIQDGRLTLIPIVAKFDAPGTKFITLHDGMAKGLVTVREHAEWEVDTVQITNKSSEPLVVISGELIVDAMQDRVTAENTIITAGLTRSVQVRCVEEDRDHGGSVFHAGNALAELDLRRTVVHSEQENVWAKVKQINRRDGISTPTNTYRHAAHAQTKQDTRRQALLAALEAREDRRQIVGLAVAIDDKVIAVDRFATPELYRALEPELLASYLPATTGPLVEGKKVGPADVRALVKLAGATTVNDATTITLRPL
ncbi:MAG: DUF6569 family protein [Kofleriaceae bacterium]